MVFPALTSEENKEGGEGYASAPHILPMLNKGRAGQAFGERISHVLGAKALVELKLAELNTFPQEVIFDVDMPRALAIDRVLTHKNTGSVVFPHEWG